MIAFRTKPEEEEMIKAYAEQKGISVSDFLRETALERIKLDMTIVEAIVYTRLEFNNILNKATDNKISVYSDVGGYWSYGESYLFKSEISNEEVYDMLNKYYNSLKMNINVKEVIIDNTKNRVVVVIN